MEHKLTTVAHGEKIREEILQVIINYIEKHKYPPTIREIGEMVGLKSTSSVHAHVEKMLKEGTLETDTGNSSSRALRVPGYKFVKEEEELKVKHEQNITTI